MKNGRCPKCNSSTVCKQTSSLNTDVSSVPFLGSSLVYWDAYLCTHCGYTEFYIADTGKLSKIAKKWAKV